MTPELTPGSMPESMPELTPEQEDFMHGKVNEAVCNSMSWLLKIMAEQYGEVAYQVFVKARGKEILRHMGKRAQKLGSNTIEAFIKDQWEVLPEQGYDYTMEKKETGFLMNVTKCPLYELAKRHGITEQMFYLCCEGDQFAPEGFNPDIGFKRTKTLMQGDDCCNHFYYYKIGE